MNTIVIIFKLIAQGLHLTLYWGYIPQYSNMFIMLASNFAELEGAYWFGSVRRVSRVSSALVTLSTWSGTVGARILKFGMWFVYEN